MLPDPREQPLLRPADLVGHTPMGRSAIYEAIARGDIPVVRYGRRVYVVNAALQHQWGIDDHDAAREAPRDRVEVDPACGGDAA